MNTPQHGGDFESIHRGFHSLNPTSCCLEHAAEAHAPIIPTLPTLSSVDKEIAYLNSVMDNLNRIRIDKMQLRNQCIPISSLPPEILQEIFIASLPLDKLNMALRLGHVCSQWRMVALKLPILWDAIYCHVDHPRKSQILAELIYSWISRSKGRPLTIHVSFNNDSLWMSQDAPTHIIDTLILFSEQWKDVTMTLPISWRTSLPSVKGRLDSLETLRIQPPSSVIDFSPLDAFSVAPRLCTLSFERYYLLNLVFPWTNITKAAIRRQSLDEVFEFLSRCPLLTECFIMDPVGNENIFPLPLGGVIHGGIKDLTIMLYRDDQRPAMLLRDILEPLVTPSLERLTVLLKEYDHPLHDLSTLIERSDCPLSLVEIFGPTISEDEIVTFICDTDCVLHITNNPREGRTWNWTV